MCSLRCVHVCYGINCRHGINYAYVCGTNCRRGNLCREHKYQLSPTTIYAENSVCRGHHRRQYMLQEKITGMYCRRRSLLLSIFSFYCFFYLVNGSKGVLCYSYFYVTLCFKCKNKVILECRFISIFLVPNLSYQTYLKLVYRYNSFYCDETNGFYPYLPFHNLCLFC